MATFGWIVLTVLSGMGTVLYGIVACMGLGRYNIGGVQNSAIKKTALVVVGVALALWWIKLVDLSPFAIVAK